MAALGTEVVSDLRRATGVKHDRRTEPSATNTANAGSPKYQLNLAVTSTANDGWKTFTQQWPNHQHDRLEAPIDGAAHDQRRSRTLSLRPAANPVVYRWHGERIVMGPCGAAAAVYPPMRLVRWKLMKERCRLRSVGMPTTPVRARRDGGALI